MMSLTIDRKINISLPAGQSAFLWGPRKTGKSTYLKNKFLESTYIDLLKTDLSLKYTTRPYLLREELLAMDNIVQPIIIDEVQKVPALLDEVQWLIENKKYSFILCGSSARKLKRNNANMLGGRAWKFELFPFVSDEIADYDILDVFNKGLIPNHYLGAHPKRSLKSYTEDYLKEEVFNEGLVRNIPAFSRFFETMAYCNGEELNYSKIATDCGVNSKTVRSYFEILVDTLVGHFLLPYNRQIGRDIITKRPKFYLFDIGVSNYLQKRMITEKRGSHFGQSLEQFIFLELLAYASYSEKNFPIFYWRTKAGHEVDFILGNGEIAIEVKGTQNLRNRDFQGLKKFIIDYQPKKCYVVCQETTARITEQNIHVIHYRDFLERLWNDQIL